LLMLYGQLGLAVAAVSVKTRSKILRRGTCAQRPTTIAELMALMMRRDGTTLQRQAPQERD
jgi:hypothetical protein